MKFVKYIIISLVVLICGCRQKFVSISEVSPYNSLVGTTFQSLVPMRLHGITSDKDYKQQVDYYVLTASTGISGPEVVTNRDLPAETRITILDVQRCTNCFLNSPIVFETKLHSIEIPDNYSLLLYAKTEKLENQGSITLSSEFFIKAEPDRAL